jgi:hypothetical protein
VHRSSLWNTFALLPPAPASVDDVSDVDLDDVSDGVLDAVFFDDLIDEVAALLPEPAVAPGGAGDIGHDGSHVGLDAAIGNPIDIGELASVLNGQGFLI